MTMPGVVVGLPTRQFTPGAAYASLTRELALSPYIVEVVSPIDTYLAQARNKIAAAALQVYRAGQATHLLWLDDDILVPARTPDEPGIIERLLEHEKQFCSGLYFSGVTAAPMASLPSAARSGIQDHARDHRPLLRISPDAGLIEVGAVGFGCVLEDLALLDQMDRTFPGSPMFQIVEGYAGEDYFHCWRLEQMGVHMYLDSSLILGHMKFRSTGYQTYQTQWDDATIAGAEAGQGYSLIGQGDVLEDVDSLASEGLS